MQNTYILLRNNVESTALTLDDLKKTGLLPTDLLWVECQSVSWRHPDEIPELKALLNYVPVPDEETPEKVIYEKYAPRVTTILPENEPEEPEPAKPLPRGNFLRQQKPAIEHIYAEQPTTAKTINDSAKQSFHTMQDTLLVKENADSTFNGPATNDKAAMLESLLTLPRKTILLYGSLIAAGAILMFIIIGSGNRANTMTQQPSPVVTPVAQPADNSSNDSMDEAIPAADSSTIPESYTQQNPPIEETNPIPAPQIPAAKITEQQPGTATTRQQPAPAKKKEVPKENVIPVNEPTAAKPSIVAEQPVKKTVPAENISSQLQVKLNNYNVAAFGGIRNLVLSLQNNSAYFLDHVSVEIQYLNPEGAIVKKDQVEFKFIPSGETASIAVSKSTRGVKVNTKIITIQTKDLASNQSANGNPGN